jgi:hypothetical protein
MVDPVIYRYTGVAPGTPAAISSLVLGSWDSNSSLALYPVKKTTGTVYSYIATLAIGFPTDPGTVGSLRLWAVLSGGSMDSNVRIGISTTFADTYIQATGTVSNSGNSINTVYGLTTEDITTYTSGSPKIINGSDMYATSGTGRFSKFFLVQAEIGAAANLGAVPADPVELHLYCAAPEVA